MFSGKSSRATVIPLLFLMVRKYAPIRPLGGQGYHAITTIRTAQQIRESLRCFFLERVHRNKSVLESFDARPGEALYLLIQIEEADAEQPCKFSTYRRFTNAANAC